MPLFKGHSRRSNHWSRALRDRLTRPGMGTPQAIRPHCVSINLTFLFADLDRKLVK
jgi:hypothetical protein